MKTTIRFSVFMLISMLFTACDKMPENGDLDGLWQLMSIQQGNTLNEVKSDKKYCSFQLKLFMLGTTKTSEEFDKDGARAYYGYFEHNGSTIHFHKFTYRSDYVEGGKKDELMTDEKDLPVIERWGFYSTDCTFNVVKLNKKELILEHADTKIVYRKL